MSAAYIGQLESMTVDTKKNPSDLLVDRLADELEINSVWLKTGEGERVLNKFQQYSAAVQEKLEEDELIRQMINEAQDHYKTGEKNISILDEALILMLNDLPIETRKRLKTEIIMAWAMAKKQNPRL